MANTEGYHQYEFNPHHTTVTRDTYSVVRLRTPVLNPVAIMHAERSAAKLIPCTKQPCHFHETREERVGPQQLPLNRTPRNHGQID